MLKNPLKEIANKRRELL